MVKEQPSSRRTSSASRTSASKAKGAGAEGARDGDGSKERGQEKKQRVQRAKEQTQERAQEKAREEDARDWVMFDARNLVVGRLASEIARCLRGKDNPAFCPHQDSGRHVLVVNTDHLHFTGNKRQQKLYYRHTGYPGGIKSRSVKELFEKNRSTDILRNAVKGMLPRGVLGRSQLRKLRLYGGEVHRQGAQQPKTIDFAAQSAKNSKR